MTQTTQFVSFPFALGEFQIIMASTAKSASIVRMENGQVTMSVGPDWLESVPVGRKIKIQPVSEQVPANFKEAGEVVRGGQPYKVLVEFPVQ